MRLILIAMLSLAGCASAPGAPTITIGCPPIATYSAAQQLRVAAELTALPPEDADLALFISDYETLRDAARACQQFNSGVFK